VTADHWTFVVAAYAVTAVALGGYWRFLCRREKQLGAAPVDERR
jgi:hypothetical protein